MVDSSIRIGLEVHCQLTCVPTKLFCSCSSDYREKDPNTVICPVCFGIPGSLPVVSKKAVECAVTIALALNCSIAERTLFYRKNYFYPDLPKSFQISQYDKAGGIPIATNGSVRLEDREVRIRRVQLEEDPGKLTYEGTIEHSSHSFVDYNRSGIPLVEIVTEPDISSARDAKIFLARLRRIIEFLGVSNGELEGAMRCDANVSLGSGSRVEIKNISSFKEVEKALSYEILRQRTFEAEGPKKKSETRHWDERRSITIALRTKEEEQDYRYFPEPDLVPVHFTASDVERIRSATLELPEARAERYVKENGIHEQVALEIARDRVLSKLFDETVKRHYNAVEVANWLVGEVRKNRSREGKIPLKPQAFAELLSMVEANALTRVQARDVLREMITTGESAEAVVTRTGHRAVTDETLLGEIVEKVLALRQNLIQKAREDPKAFNFLIGQVIQQDKKADPRVVATLLRERLGERKK